MADETGDAAGNAIRYLILTTHCFDRKSVLRGNWYDKKSQQQSKSETTQYRATNGFQFAYRSFRN